MIAVSVGDIDCGEILAACDDPIQQSLRLLDREKSVHENGVALTVDKRRRIRHPHQLFLAGRQIPSKARALYRKYVPLKIGVRSVQLSHRHTPCCRERFVMSELHAAKASCIAICVTDASRWD